MHRILSFVVTDTFGSGQDATLNATLNPRLRYLRVEVSGQAPVLMVLGYLDPDPQGLMEVWYSGGHEVIKLQNGRIVGTSGLALDWRAVRHPLPLPDWTSLPLRPQIEAPTRYARLRDEMPGHRYDVADEITVRPWPGMPPIALPTTLSPTQAGRYHWFQESTTGHAGTPLPPAWFAWGRYQGKDVVVYSEQCISPTLCLKLQRWPTQESIF